MKKKTIFMVMMLVAAMSNPVMAADTENTEDRTEVTYDVDSVYTVVIPESAQLGSDMNITSTSMNIDVNEAVNVYIKEGVENGVMTLKRDFNEYNVPLNVDTIRRRDPIRWTNKKGTDSLIVDTEKRVF